MSEKVIRPNFSDLPKDKEVYFLASGGRDSTAFVLEAWKLGIKGTMILGDTGVNRPSAIQTLERLEKDTGFLLVRVKPDTDRRPIEILKDSFLRIPKALEELEKGRTYKRVFPCCDDLKKKPMNKWFKERDPENSVFVMGIKTGDNALHRKFRLRELRDRGTFLRRHVKNGFLYHYPLRDCYDRDITAILKEFGYGSVKSSGCAMCPIFCVADWRKRDPDTWLRSVRYAKRLGIEFPGTDQTDLRDFCSGVE